MGRGYHPAPDAALPPTPTGPLGLIGPSTEQSRTPNPTAGCWILLCTPLQRCSLTELEKQRRVEQTHTQGRVYTGITTTKVGRWALPPLPSSC